jgi:hypothetical protein
MMKGMPRQDEAIMAVNQWLGPEAVTQLMAQKGRNWTQAMSAGSAAAGGIGEQAMAGLAGLLGKGMSGKEARKGFKGFGFEKGGRVPKTGTYKLHKREVVIPANAADAMFPYAMRGPKGSKGKAEKSYEKGTGAVDESFFRKWGRAQRYGIDQIMEMIAALGQPAEEVAAGFGGAGPPAPVAPPERVPPQARELPAGLYPEAAPEEPFAPIAPTTKGGEQEWVKEYKIEGKPETEAEEKKRIREEIKRNKESAKYHRSRANLLLSYFTDQPEKLGDPKVKALLSQRQFLAQQFQGEADKEEARLDKMEQAEKQQETMRDIQRISTGGKTELANIQAMVKMRDYYRDAFGDTQKQVQDIIKDQGTDRNDPMYRARMQTAYMTFVPLLAQSLGQSPEQTQAYIAQAIEMSISDPNKLGLLNGMISQSLERMG